MMLLRSGTRSHHCNDVMVYYMKMAYAFILQSNGWTALMLASRRGYLNVVKILLDYNADPNMPNNVNL